MILFPQTFVNVLVWAALGLAALDVLVLAGLWIRDMKRGELW